MVPTLVKNQKGQKKSSFPAFRPSHWISYFVLSPPLSHITLTHPQRERERERERECGGAFGATLKMDTPVKNQLATTSKFEVFPINPTLSIVFLFVILIIIVLFFFLQNKIVLFGYREIELEKNNTHVFNFTISSILLPKIRKTHFPLLKSSLCSSVKIQFGGFSSLWFLML